MLQLQKHIPLTQKTQLIGCLIFVGLILFVISFNIDHPFQKVTYLYSNGRKWYLSNLLNKLHVKKIKQEYDLKKNTNIKVLKKLGIFQFSQLINSLLSSVQYSQQKGLIIKSQQYGTFLQPKDYLLDFLCENEDLQESDELSQQFEELLSLSQDFQLSVFQLISEFPSLPFTKQQSQRTYQLNLSNIQETARDLIETVNLTFLKIYETQDSLNNIIQRLDLIIIIFTEKSLWAYEMEKLTESQIFRNNQQQVNGLNFLCQNYISMFHQTDSVDEFKTSLASDLLILKNQDFQKCCNQVNNMDNEKLNVIEVLIIFTLQFNYIGNEYVKNQTQQQFQLINNFIKHLETYKTCVVWFGDFKFCIQLIINFNSAISFVEKISLFRINNLRKYQNFHNVYQFQNDNFGKIEETFVSILNQNIIGDKIKCLCQLQDKVLLSNEKELFKTLIIVNFKSKKITLPYQINDLENLIYSQQRKFESISQYLKQNICVQQKQLDSQRLNGNDQIQEILTQAYDTISFLIDRVKTTEDNQEKDKDAEDIISSLKTAIFKLTNLKQQHQNNEKIPQLILKINFLTKKIGLIIQNKQQICIVQDFIDPFFNEQLFPLLKISSQQTEGLFKQYSIYRQDTLNHNTIVQSVSSQIVESLNSTFFSYSEILKSAIQKCSSINKTAGENLELYLQWGNQLLKDIQQQQSQTVQAWEVEQQSFYQIQCNKNPNCSHSFPVGALHLCN